MGMVQKLLHTLSHRGGISHRTNEMITMINVSECNTCGHFSKVCPMQLKPYEVSGEMNQFYEADCIKCGVCVDNCKKELLVLCNEHTASKLQDKNN